MLDVSRYCCSILSEMSAVEFAVSFMDLFAAFIFLLYGSTLQCCVITKLGYMSSLLSAVVVCCTVPTAAMLTLVSDV